MNFQKMTITELLARYESNLYSLISYEQAGRDYDIQYNRLRQIQKDIEAEASRRDALTQDDGSHDETDPHHHWPGAVAIQHPEL